MNFARTKLRGFLIQAAGLSYKEFLEKLRKIPVGTKEIVFHFTPPKMSYHGIPIRFQINEQGPRMVSFRMGGMDASNREEANYG